MSPGFTSRRFRRSAGVAALLLLLAGCGDASGTASGEDTSATTTSSPAAVSATKSPQSQQGSDTGAAGSETASGGGAAAGSGGAPSAGSSAESQDAKPVTKNSGMPASEPVSFSIPALDRQAKIIKTGLRDDRTLEVPPEREGAPASWFKGSPAPGETGASVLLGHVNSLADDSGVFYNLDKLENGDEISVLREDGTTANFAVYKTEVYPKDDFPTKAVYYPTDEPELRLITCGGFTASSGLFEKNVVVYAEFTGSS